MSKSRIVFKFKSVCCDELYSVPELSKEYLQEAADRALFNFKQIETLVFNEKEGKGYIVDSKSNTVYFEILDLIEL